jgi:sortase B
MNLYENSFIVRKEMKFIKNNIIKKTWDRLILFYFRNKPATREQWIRLAVMALSAAVFLFCAASLGYKVISDAADAWNNDRIASLRSNSASGRSEPVSIALSSEDSLVTGPYKVVKDSSTALNADGRLPEYEDLWQRNKDMVGWVSMPGFSARDIDYPILYSGDNEYYLDRNFDKQYAKSGSIFLEESNTSYPSDPLKLDYNYVLYGHAMLNMTMFGQLTDYYKNETAWENATTIYVDFMNTRLEYEVFSTFLVDPAYNYRQTSFYSDEEYQAYLGNMLAISTHDFGIEVGVEDRIVTLSTCYKSTQRTGIVGKLVKQTIYERGTESETAGVTPVLLPTDEPSASS